MAKNGDAPPADDAGGADDELKSRTAKQAGVSFAPEPEAEPTARPAEDALDEGADDRHHGYVDTVATGVTTPTGAAVDLSTLERPE